MVFSSMTFIWIFLPVLLIVNFAAKEKYRNFILLIFSLLFYSWGEPKYIVVMLLSIIINYFFGLVIGKLKKSKTRKIVFIFNIFINIGFLGFFKYYSFISHTINSLFNLYLLPYLEIDLPIGISFYTFQVMSYIIDLYRGNIKVQKNILKLALYISFFPQLIAGPIVRYLDINKQIDSRVISKEKFAQGIKRFIYGLSKKVIVANTLAQVADLTFNAKVNELSFSLAWLGAFGYMLQIYYDFSGYSDMAIGLGKMFGFEFLENFNYPYISQSMTEFWRRWHISLSTWFKEYLYIPLGGNRKGKIRTYINLGIVFLCTGLWHGAAWNFVIWGIYHGFFLIIERIKLKELLDKNKLKCFNYIYMLLVTLFGWILFRADSILHALSYIKQMFCGKSNSVLVNLNGINVINSKTTFMIIIGILFSGIVQSLLKRIKNNTKIKNLMYALEPCVLAILFSICIMELVANTYNPFIYFRF